MTTGSTQAPQIGFLKIAVADLDRSRTFYEAGFGMSAGAPIVQTGVTEQVLKSPDNAFAMTLVNHTDGRAIDAGGSTGAVPFYVGFYVRGMEQAIARAQAAGARLLRGPERFGEVSFAFLEDPDGHVIELIDRGA